MDDNVSEINSLAVKRMEESEGWSELVREIGFMIDDLKDLLVAGDEDADRHRGRIDGLRTILGWPEIVNETAHYGNKFTIATEEDE